MADHLGVFAVGQHLVLILGVEVHRVHPEAERLALEVGAFVRADEEHVLHLVDVVAHQDHLQTNRQTNKRLINKQGDRVQIFFCRPLMHAVP